jgi:outer membrane protein OmpA-like peptidoglycan-associated protein
MIKNRRFAFIVVLILAVVFVSLACIRNQRTVQKNKPTPTTAPTTTEEKAPVESAVSTVNKATPPASVQVSVQAAKTVTTPVTKPSKANNKKLIFKTVYFDYNKATLSKDAKDILKKNAAILSDNPNVKVIVVGFCDDIGSYKYNILLGKNRANAVKKYYVKLGISPKRIAITSFGEKNIKDKVKSVKNRKLNRKASTRKTA